jgi:hypothetical protein
MEMPFMLDSETMALFKTKKIIANSTFCLDIQELN